MRRTAKMDTPPMMPPIISEVLVLAVDDEIEGDGVDVAGAGT